MIRNVESPPTLDPRVPLIQTTAENQVVQLRQDSSKHDPIFNLFNPANHASQGLLTHCSQLNMISCTLVHVQRYSRFVSHLQTTTRSTCVMH